MSEQTAAQDGTLALDPTARWVVTATLATVHEVTESALVHMDEQAEQRYGATVAARADGPGLVFTAEVPGEDVALVAGLAARVAEDVAGYGVSSAIWLVDLHVRTPEQYEADALREDIPALAGAADVAELLGVSRQRVHQLATENTAFPAPVARLAVGPIWTVAAIQAFDAGWARRTGRPRKVAAAG